MFLLILESLGSTELFFILIMALIFFGPRKLPQISRSLGKNLAEFRRASEDFKRTWDREVSLEESAGPEQNSTRDFETSGQSFSSPSIAAITPDEVIARNTSGGDPLTASESVTVESSDFASSADEPNHSPKNDWL